MKIANTRAANHREINVPNIESHEPFGSRSPSRLQQFLIGLSRKTPLSRGHLRRIMTNLIVSLGSEKGLDVEFQQANFRIGLDQNLIENGLLLKPDYNQKDIEFLLDGMPNSGGVMVDIGSNIGLYSLPMALKAGPEANIICIDANPLMAFRLNANAMFSNLDNVQMFCCAVSDSEGTGTLNVRNDDLAIVNIVEDGNGETPIRTLASIIHESGVDHVDCLKIDIEGHEDRALVPYLESVDEAFVPSRIVIEHLIPEGWSGCARTFTKMGYREFGRTKTNALFTRD